MPSEHLRFLFIKIFPIIIIIASLISANIKRLSSTNCYDSSTQKLPVFHFIQRYQRSKLPLIDLENTQTLEECMIFARRVKGLAINYGPSSGRYRQLAKTTVAPLSVETRASYKTPLNFTRRPKHYKDFWQEPEEFFNCHVLQCPENATFKTMVYDRRFNYYSLYAEAPASGNYSCLPEIGLFQIIPEPVNYVTSSENCVNLKGALAHIVSAKRTEALAQLLIDYNEQIQYQITSKSLKKNNMHIYLAYVGLYSFMSIRNTRRPNEFYTTYNENLKCFLYRAWSPGYPNSIKNSSRCVAITHQATWVDVDCEQKLPSICEIHVSKILNRNIGDGEKI